MGHSTAKWERDVLVVDTAGFNDRIWVGMNNGRLPHTEMLHMTERYRRVDFGHMEIKAELKKRYRELFGEASKSSNKQFRPRTLLSDLFDGRVAAAGDGDLAPIMNRLVIPDAMH
jgi:hypothetical protein